MTQSSTLGAKWLLNIAAVYVTLPFFLLFFMVFSFSFLAGGVTPDAMCRSYKLKRTDNCEQNTCIYELDNCYVQFFIAHFSHQMV